MGLIFDAYKILPCVLNLILFSSLYWMFISHVIMMSPGIYTFCLQPLLCQLFSPIAPISQLYVHPHNLGF